MRNEVAYEIVKISSTTARAMARAVRLDPRRNSGAADSSARGVAAFGVRADEEGLRTSLRARGFPRPGPGPPGREVGRGPDGIASGPEPRERRCAGVAGCVVEILFNPQQLVVLGYPVGTRRSAGLDLAAVSRHCKISDGRVRGLAGTMAQHATEAGPVGQIDGIE